MLIMEAPQTVQWPLWKKILFRFFFIFISLYIAPWTWLDSVLFEIKAEWLTRWYSDAEDWAVRLANDKIFHIKNVLVPVSGSGDTSWGWAQLYLFLLLGFAGCIIWSLIDHRRKNYVRLDYWLCLFTRYYLALFAFAYGIIKVFVLQMPFPNLSMQATYLGDLLPMRLSWMFMGYSGPYQFFSGAMEVLAGILLLFRRTATLGTLVGAGVFLNVMVMNLSYDIPVKIFSMRLELFSLFLLAHEKDRLISFFIKNKPAAPAHLYNVSFARKWMRISRIAIKLLFIGVMVVFVLYQTYTRYKEINATPKAGPIAVGMYDVETFVINKDTIPPLLGDTLRWQDIIFERRFGTVKSTDTLFRKLYNRGYFLYSVDTIKHTLGFKRLPQDTTFGYFFTYEIPDNRTIVLRGTSRNDSLFIVLRKSKRHFQLAEKQFHWLSESNR
ncbi:MAG TPA: hypothetical protein VFP97_00095 [Chitinophagaceae bacterium]|nr:hypothetical protein [Chitinophagaceae bacterium]